MKQIYYVIQALIHGRSSNIIKVVSLGSVSYTHLDVYKRQVLHGAPNTSKLIIKARDKCETVYNPFLKYIYHAIMYLSLIHI